MFESDPNLDGMYKTILIFMFSYIITIIILMLVLVTYIILK
jgi:hypothetical protein